MGPELRTGVLAVLLPIAVVVAGGAVLQEISGRAKVADTGKPLMRRWNGYSIEVVGRYWERLERAGRQAEKRFLELDLLFPFAYGGAILAASLVVWSRLGRPFSVGWLVAGVALTAVADWTENLVQLRELTRFMTSGPSGLEPGWIRIASAATMTKLLAFSASALGLLALVVAYVRRAVG